MANNVTTRTPARTEPIVKPPHDRELHPAITDTMERFSAVWTDNDRLVNDNHRLSTDNETLRRINAEQLSLINDLRSQLITMQTNADERVSKFEAHYRSRLLESERAKEHYLRYAVSLSERLQACTEQIAAAHTLALNMARADIDLEHELSGLVSKMQK